MNLNEEIQELTNVLGEDRVKETLKKLSEIEASRRFLYITKLKDEMSLFEKNFNMSSDEAWDAYNRGQLGDSMDIMEWMALYENLLEYQAKHDRLRKVC